ncbi:acetoin utilization protein AcuB [Anaerosolibacter carboniphilus]|uniref:Acetoin utilization protein AcuB n=1 Tax=Anaerosolibacter carboniphilus TaxID=1417629 RepID=A0A841KYT8_9FIRM|nr:CBS domain-containing protein [Anaerosolibacter carboniphilus]MBB6218794.1 acetoin utilization protein AcuB [Anaerosolibacter carboniphilus]
MIIRNIMLKRENLLVLENSQKVQEALEKIKSEGYLSLPVVEDNRFIGCISVYDIYQKYYEKDDAARNEFLNSTLSDHVKTDIPILQAKDIVEDASLLFSNKNIPFIPVVDDKSAFLGIVTQKAIFSAFTRLLGNGRGTRLTIHTPDFKGRISKLAKAIKNAEGNIISLAINDPDAKMDIKEIIVRLEASNIERVKEFIEKKGFKIVEIE